MITKPFLIRYTFVLCMFSSCAPASILDSPEIADQKITFDLTEIDENGLMGPPDGRVLIAYIFYIPVLESNQKEVASIDPSVRFFRREDYYQCIGSGGSPKVIRKLARLPYIKKINRFYGE